MGDRKVVKMVKGGKTDLSESIKAFREFALFAPELAKTRMCFFKAYVSEGFTPEQAIELCKNITGM